MNFKDLKYVHHKNEFIEDLPVFLLFSMSRMETWHHTVFIPDKYSGGDIGSHGDIHLCCSGAQKVIQVLKGVSTV